MFAPIDDIKINDSYISRRRDTVDQWETYGNNRNRTNYNLRGWDNTQILNISEKTAKISLFQSGKSIYTKQDLTISTSEGNFILDEKLNNIYNTIQESKVLLNYKDDWDDEGAIGCDMSTYDKAVNLLIKYSQNVLRYQNLIIQAPEINLGRDGSIDLEWRNENSIFLITILNTNKFEAHFYGDDNETVVKGTLTDYTINRVLSCWMKCLV